jgi:hypothetical protein
MLPKRQTQKPPNTNTTKPDLVTTQWIFSTFNTKYYGVKLFLPWLKMNLSLIYRLIFFPSNIFHRAIFFETNSKLSDDSPLLMLLPTAVKLLLKLGEQPAASPGSCSCYSSCYTQPKWLFSVKLWVVFCFFLIPFWLLVSPSAGILPKAFLFQIFWVVRWEKQRREFDIGILIQVLLWIIRYNVMLLEFLSFLDATYLNFET